MGAVLCVDGPERGGTWRSLLSLPSTIDQVAVVLPDAPAGVDCEPARARATEVAGRSGGWQPPPSAAAGQSPERSPDVGPVPGLGVMALQQIAAKEAAQRHLRVGCHSAGARRLRCSA